MSVLAYPPTNDEEIFRHCTKECGIITSTEDQQYFALVCITCSEKFLYFDSFIEHMQTMHTSYDSDGSNPLVSGGGNTFSRNKNDKNKLKRRLESDSEEDLTALLQPSVVMIKEEKIEADDDEDNGTLIQNEPLANDDDDDYAGSYYSVKQEQANVDLSMDLGDSSYMGDSYGSYNDDYVGDDDDIDQSNNGDDANYDDLVEESLLERNSRKMSINHVQDSKEKLKYSPQQVNPKRLSCETLSRKFDLYADTAQKQYNTLVGILAEQKVLIDHIFTLNAAAANPMGIFPINTEEKLKEFDAILASQRDPYIRQIKSLLADNAERNLHQVFGQGIILNFNIDGSFGKKRLRDFGNVFTVMTDVISTFSEIPERTLRAAFQRQKKKYFKQTSRNKTKNNEQSRKEGDPSDHEKNKK